MYAIACVDNSLGLGYKGDLLVKSKIDMEHFKTFTAQQHIIVGRKTFESMNITSTNGRIFHVITSSMMSSVHDRLRGKSSNIFIYNSPEDVMKAIKASGKIYKAVPPVVIGGASIYKAFMPYIDTVILTVAHYNAPDVDSYFPSEILNINEWKRMVLDRWNEALVINDRLVNFGFERQLVQRINPITED